MIIVSDLSAANTSKKPPYLRISRLTKKFGEFVALDDISLEVNDGEFVCFLGPSGCGKTTFLRAIAGLDIQTSGTVHQADIDISALPPSERDFGIVFQSYALFPNLTVEKNIAFGLENQKLSRADIKKRVDELLELVGLPEQEKKYPSQLSGGQQQRIALARAIATSPGLLLLDEPLSALDAKVRVYLRQEVKALQQKLAVTTVMVTHDQEEALTMADRIVVMNQGVIDQIGTPTEIYREPKTLFVADFIGTMNHVNGLAGTPESARLGSLELACRKHSLAPGQPAVISIRPEDIVPIDDIDATEAQTGNSFNATVKDMEFLGSFWRLHLSDEQLGNSQLVIDLSVNAVIRMNTSVGKRMSIKLPSDRLMVFDPTTN
ncbi:MAG: putative 2-aminoethylphosphonate ABC transporter ATP-binding protein [Deltaproteobacteria bacterium]|nr:MAG: putative 2-aminoethylphosphonate ABC transporter ATP-binding protein [Deltaproteobacteria bacterium]RLC08740.1 MAG: putative 2-aminoethylphosphonate ABC transporter ATP-binding protein [Deltaproteobacteria bacterium]